MKRQENLQFFYFTFISVFADGIAEDVFDQPGILSHEFGSSGISIGDSKIAFSNIFFNKFNFQTDQSFQISAFFHNHLQIFN